MPGKHRKVPFCLGVPRFAGSTGLIFWGSVSDSMFVSVAVCVLWLTNSQPFHL